MTQRTSAPPLENLPRPRPLVVNTTPCRTGIFLAFIVLATAVLGTDRYLTNDAVRRVEEVETWGVRETAQIIATEESQRRVMIAVRANELLARQLALVQERLDRVSIESVKLLHENILLREAIAPSTGPTTGPATGPGDGLHYAPKTDKAA